MTSQLVTDALLVAVWRRGSAVAVLHHSDQGSQFTNGRFQDLPREQGIRCSLSRAGEVWDKSGHGEILQFNEDRAHGAQGQPKPGRNQGRRVRLHRALLQPVAPAFDVGLSLR